MEKEKSAYKMLAHMQLLESETSFERLFKEEIKNLDKEELAKFQLKRAIGVIEDGPSVGFKNKVFGMYIVEPSGSHVATLYLPKDKNKRLTESILGLYWSLLHNNLSLHYSSSVAFPELMLSGDTFYDKGIVDVLSAGKDVERDMLSKITFGKKYGELKDDEKYGIIIHRLFATQYRPTFKLTLTVPSIEEYGNLVHLAIMTHPLLIDIRENRSFNEPVLDGVWDKFMGPEQVRSFLKTLIKEYEEENGYKGARIGAYLYLPESGSDASATLEELAQKAYNPDFVIVCEAKGEGGAPTLKAVDREMKGEKEISDFLYALGVEKSKSRKLLRADSNQPLGL
ncbi:MAG: hypothetical protein M1360_00260 [Candidatus Marsarchaeota archaeon]|jgi:hypothetical protein|nr:hypothetical protein [Candidatus Marsarchaeota archaeon]MCL5418358.1 hypothetical protein [Candidatus Marsarchaeota archaeon]